MFYVTMQQLLEARFLSPVFLSQFRTRRCQVSGLLTRDHSFGVAGSHNSLISGVIPILAARVMGTDSRPTDQSLGLG